MTLVWRNEATHTWRRYATTDHRFLIVNRHPNNHSNLYANWKLTEGEKVVGSFTTLKEAKALAQEISDRSSA